MRAARPIICMPRILTSCGVLSAEEYLLEQPKNYSFLTFGNVSVNGVDDAHEFKATLDAMHIMGMNQDDLQCELLGQWELWWARQPEFTGPRRWAV